MELAPPPLRFDLAALLPQVAPAAAECARLLHDRRLAPLWGELAAGSGALTVSPVADAGTGTLYDLMLDSDAGLVALAVAVDDDAALAMVAAAGLSPSLRALALGALFDEPISRLAALALPGARAVALTPLSRSALAVGGWCAVRRGGVELCRIAPTQLAAPVQDALRAVRRGAPARAAWRARLRLPTAVVIGERRLSIATLRSLAPGDVVLPAETITTLAGAPVTWRVGRAGALSLTAAAVLEERSLTLLGDLHMTDDDGAYPAMTEDAGTGAALEALELPVHFELETVAMPLADLEAVEPGYVIEFGMPAAQARLRLVACGVVIGEADLVAIGNRLGARITHLVPRHESEQQRG